MRVGYEEGFLASILKREKTAARRSGVSRRWETLYESLYNKLQMETGREPRATGLVSGSEPEL
jgi:hypothetical protein